MKKTSYTLALLLACFCSYGQVPFWGFNYGGIVAAPGEDRGYHCKVGPNGNVYVTGRFSGTMDLDPGVGVNTISSSGLTDIFLACYTPTGAFVWGFGIGGGDNDCGIKVAVDPSNNVIICGVYQTSADFDPGPGVVTLTSMGGIGAGISGEGFVAKYSPTGAFLWAQSLGGTTAFDYAEGLETDGAGNIYVSGEYNGSMTISGSITFNSAVTGSAYLIKYDPAGTVIWGHSFGQPGVAGVTTCARDLKVRGGFIYACGHFQGTADFNTWGAPAFLSTGGSTDIDAFIAKYDVNGNFVFVNQVSGSSPEDAFGGIAMDASDNMYVTGWTRSPSVVYNTASPGTSTVMAPGGGGNLDFHMAKFNSSGVYQWGHVYGGPGDDWSQMGIDQSGTSIYVTGWFNNTVDFNASAVIANLTSSGLSDMFVARYNTNGDYVCAFRAGSASVEDKGSGIAASPAGEIYTTGWFGGAATDFDPSVSTLPLTSLGGTDIYMVKYDVCGSLINPTCDSIGLADTIDVCIGDTVTLKATLFGTNPLLSSIWTPSTGLSSTTSLTPLLTSSTSGYYKLSIRSILPTNLVVNGDFTDGNTGFTSSYTYAAPPSGTLIEGNYSVYTNPNGVHSGFTMMGDHTSGSGNMMIINGGPTSVDVWCQTIAVTPNTDYDFSAWFANCSSVTVPPDVPTLQFRINGILQGVPTPVTAAPGTWVNFSTTWNSGPSTSAAICIYDAVTTASGNDFVIDDILFREICEVSDSVYVDVHTPETTFNAHDTTICNAAFPRTLAGETGHTSYLWSTGATTATISATTPGTYWVRATTLCDIAIDTFVINTFPNPVVALGNDTAFCVGNTIVLSSPQPAGSSWAWSTGATGDTIHVSTTGSYSLTVTNSDACTANDAINVTVSPHPLVNLGPDTVECHGRPILLMSSVLYTAPAYLWQDNTTGPTLTATATGTYWLQVTEYGCSGADTIHIEIKFDTFTLYNPDTAICKGRSVQVRATGDPNITYQWLPSTGMANSAAINPLITTDTSAMYVLLARLAGCPDLRDSFFVDVQPNPDPFLGATRKMCQFDSVRIRSYVDPPWYKHYTYSWAPTTNIDYPTLPEVVFRAGANTNLVLTVTTPIGCMGKDSVAIIVYPGNFATISNDTTLCPGDSVRLVAAGGITYQWSPSMYLDDATSATPMARPITSQNYSLVATSVDGCRDTLKTGITVHPAAVIHLDDSATIYPGESYQISPQTNGTLFSWSPAGGLNGKYISNPLATPEVSTKYVVNTVTEHGCKAVDSIYIFLDDNGLLAVPNAFTPGSASNNKLYVIKRGMASLKAFRVYNRWGNVVFETTDLDAGWDGTYKGVPQPMGVFVYSIEAQTNKGKAITKSGNVTLLR